MEHAVVPFEHQVAGHVGSLFRHSHDRSKLIKKATLIEAEFYKLTQTRSPSELTQFVPAFHGTSNGSCEFIVIENVIDSLSIPCVMDVKLGTVLYGRDADEDKRARMTHQARITTSGTTGLRICGMKIYDAASKEYINYPKAFGRSLAPETLSTAFELFYAAVPLAARQVVISQTLQKLGHLKHAVQSSGVRLYGSSILLAYDIADVLASDSAALLKEDVGKPVVKLIDFAHSHYEQSSDGFDESAMAGLQTLEGILTRLSRVNE
ncbi:Inositol hexakisphosphate kinase 1 [Chytriomyces hyalinus]|nr:Inositol hexakisphosphate kinase 1 [Chytriomyces hyalinus]